MLLRGGHGYTKPPPGSQLDWGHPLAAGLVGCWLFNEGAGRRVVDLVSGQHADFLGGPIWSAMQHGYALSFDNAAKYASISDFADIPLGNWSVVIGTRANTLSTVVAPLALFCFWGTDDLVFYANDNSAGSGGMRVFWRDRGQNVLNESGLDLTGQDQIMCVTRRASAMTGYRDGRVVVTGSLSAGTEGPFTGIMFANFEGLAQPYAGLLSHVYIYARALTPLQVAQLAAEPYCMIAAPPARTWFVPAAAGVTIYSRRSLGPRTGSRQVWA